MEGIFIWRLHSNGFTDDTVTIYRVATSMSLTMMIVIAWGSDFGSGNHVSTKGIIPVCEGEIWALGLRDPRVSICGHSLPSGYIFSQSEFSMVPGEVYSVERMWNVFRSSLSASSIIIFNAQAKLNQVKSACRQNWIESSMLILFSCSLTKLVCVITG